MAALRARGITVDKGITPVSAEVNDAAVAAFVYRDAAGTQRRLACDAIAFGFGLSSETQLADLAEIPFAYDAVQRQFLPEHDIAGRTPVRGVYLAGDGNGIAGADAAELSGERAAFALIEDRGLAVDKQRMALIEQALRKLAQFRVALEAAFPFPADLAAGISDETILCRCECVTVGEFCREARALAADDINRAKAFSRCGMGRCQGRVCGPAAAAVLAARLNLSPERMGRLRGQPPVKPIPMDVASHD